MWNTCKIISLTSLTIPKPCFLSYYYFFASHRPASSLSELDFELWLSKFIFSLIFSILCLLFPLSCLPHETVSTLRHTCTQHRWSSLIKHCADIWHCTEKVNVKIRDDKWSFLRESSLLILQFIERLEPQNRFNIKNGCILCNFPIRHECD